VRIKSILRRCLRARIIPLEMSRDARRPLATCALTFIIGAVIAAQAAAPARLVPVIFETELGRITLEVDGAHAPITAANFLRYVDAKFYDGGVVDRAVRPDNTTRHDVEIQVIQFQINPTRQADTFPPIPLERTSLTGLTHGDGTISMARGGPTRRPPRSSSRSAISTNWMLAASATPTVRGSPPSGGSSMAWTS